MSLPLFPEEVSRRIAEAIDLEVTSPPLARMKSSRKSKEAQEYGVKGMKWGERRQPDRTGDRHEITDTMHYLGVDRKEAINLIAETHIMGKETGREPTIEECKKIQDEKKRLGGSAEPEEAREVGVKGMKWGVHKPKIRKGTQATPEMRSALAKATHVPFDKEKHDKSVAFEKNVAEAIGGKHFAGHYAFDIVKGNVGIEAKVLLSGHSRVNVKSKSREIKLKEAKERGLKRLFTLALDKRPEKERALYIREGVGSYRLKTMTKLVGGLKSLGNFLRGKKSKESFGERLKQFESVRARAPVHRDLI